MRDGTRVTDPTVPPARDNVATLPLRRVRTDAPLDAEDDDNGSAEALSAALPKGRYVVVPGNHMSAVTKPELGAAMAAFLTA